MLKLYLLVFCYIFLLSSCSLDNDIDTPSQTLHQLYQKVMLNISGVVDSTPPALYIPDDIVIEARDQPA